MPKYLVTNASPFDPFSYDELVKPVARMQELQDTAQDAYDQLNVETNALQQYITNNPGDSQAKEMYDRYLEKLHSLQNNLWNNGVNAQTKRDLSEARAGYASDIARIATAVQNRQARSKEYWDAKHKNPDLVTGIDPGLSGLNDYLGDDNYGNDWYSYSGTSFSNEVGTDAKARMNEMLHDPEVRKNPALVGYIETILSEGATSEEVQAANNLVDDILAGTKSREDIKNNTSPEEILANVLLSHLDSTGAEAIRDSGRLSNDEFNRLVNYGKAGISQAIGRKKLDYLTDNVYKLNQEIAKENREYQRKKDFETWKSGLVPPETPRQTGTGEIITLKSPGYENWVKATEKEEKNYASGSHMVMNPDGTSREIHNSYEMSDFLYGSDDRNKIQSAFGVDIAQRAGKKQKFSVTLKNGTTHELTTGKLSKAEADRLGLDSDSAIAVRETDGTLNESFTKLFSNASKNHSSYVEDRIKANPDAEKMAISPEKQYKMREDSNYPAKASWSDFYPYMSTKETVGDFSSVTVAGSDSQYDYVRSNLGKQMIKQFNNASTAGGGIAKGGRFAVYKVGEGGMTREDKKGGITNLGEVLGYNSDKSIKDNTVTNISATLEDLAEARPQLRFQSSEKPGDVYSTDAMMFGPLVYNALTEKKPQIGMSTSEAIATVIDPILNPADAMNMGFRESIMWGLEAYRLIGDSVPTVKLADQSGNYSYPVVQKSDGYYRFVTPKEVVRDKDYQMRLREAARTKIADPAMAQIRQVLANEHEQHRGDSNANAVISF